MIYKHNFITVGGKVFYSGKIHKLISYMQTSYTTNYCQRGGSLKLHHSKRTPHDLSCIPRLGAYYTEAKGFRHRTLTGPLFI